MTVRWIAFQIATGDVIADIASMGYPQSALRKDIGQYNTNQISMYLDGAPPNWLRATRPGAAGLACYDDESMTNSSAPPDLQWGGFIVSRVRSLKSGTVDLSLATLDAYFDRRIVGDRSFSQTGQNDIAQTLVFNFAGDLGRYPGVPFQYECEDGEDVPGFLRDRTYLDADNATLYTRLQQLAGVDQGIEWTVDLTWDEATQSKIYPLFRYGTRIGVSPQQGRRPNAVFDGGTVTDATYTESYADGDGANVVQTYSSGQADVAPVSLPSFAPYNLRPSFEYRFQPSSSITDVALLQSYADRAASFLGEGQNSLTLTCAITEQTRYGNLWRAGDDVEAALDPSVQFPGGVDVVARAVAYEVDPQAGTISPILATDAVPTGDEEVT